MTQSFKDMLCLMGSGALGKAVTFDHKLNIEEIRWWSLHHGVWPIVHTALTMAYPEDEAILVYNKESVAHMALNIQKTSFVHNIMGIFESKGIKCCVLKGEALSHLYYQPYSRISSDYDILIDEEHEKLASKILVEQGYSVEERPTNHQHFLARHPYGGVLEVHVKMYSDTTKDILLKGMVEYNEELVSIKTDDGDIKTLGINDNLMFLTAHFLKHYLTGEITVRQISDLLLYLKHYKGKYDEGKYREMIDTLNLTSLVSAIEGIGQMYFGIETDAVYDPELVDAMLDDIEKVKFQKENVNIHSDVAEAKFAKGSLSYRIYKEKHYYKNNIVFPGPSYLVEGGYKYAKIWPLIPVAWVHRWINFFADFLKLRKVPKSQVKSDRMEIAKKLNLY